MDDEGFLRVTGRKKEIIVTSGGKNIAPSRIELLISQSPFIHQVCVVGDRRNYLTALVSPDPDNVGAWARSQGLDFASLQEMAAHESVRDLIESEVASKNRELASFETVKKVSVVPEFTIENGMLTPTMKLKKNVVVEHYRERIDAMYR
jgi:long-chain acyl-CoA synthetase